MAHQLSWYMPTIPELKKKGQGDCCKFETSNNINNKNVNE